jgi:nucleoside diphosphate kinase
MNQAFAFIKPHVMGIPAVCAEVDRRLAAAGVDVLLRQEMSGAEVAHRGVIDRHYAANARAGTCRDAAALPVSDAARAAFAAAFGETWEAAVAAGRIVSGLVMQERLGVDGETLNRLWGKQPLQKLAGGLYVARFPEQGVYVLNGFYPSNRELFTQPTARMGLMVLAFDEQRLPWRTFRDALIGTTNPALAAAGSIRGDLYRRQAEFGLTVTYRENVIHASASAFEALTEKALWLPDWPMERDPLWQALRPRGVTMAQLDAWRDANPLVTLDGRTATLLDLLESLDTQPTAAAIRRLLDSACITQ